MSLLDIDFAAAARRGPNLIGLALLLAGAAALALVSLELDDLDQQTVGAEARLKSLTRRAAPSAAGKAAVPDAAGVAAGEALARLRAPWPELLEQLEALADLPVAVLDVEAEARGRSLRLAGEAKTMDDVLALVDRLRHSPRFDEVNLQSHEQRKVAGSEVVSFTIQAAWPQTRDVAP